LSLAKFGHIKTTNSKLQAKSYTKDKRPFRPPDAALKLH
jgi:hypothetical protein